MGSRVSHIASHIKPYKHMRRSFTTNEFYHLYNRGVDRRKIFMDKNDYIRFVHDLYEFNDMNPAREFKFYYHKKEGIKGRDKENDYIKKGKNIGNNMGSRVSHIVSHIETLGATTRTKNCYKEKEINIKDIEGLMKNKKDDRDCLVNIHAFVMMSNHHHILAEQINEKGISLFMRKVHTGYTNAFNLKNERKGHLFEGPFKSVRIEDDAHYAFLICYIHANPLDIWMKDWKQKKLTDYNIKKAFDFLEKYKWSSHLDYLGKRNFPSLINKNFLLNYFDGTQGYKEFFIDWLRQYQRNKKYIKEMINN